MTFESYTEMLRKEGEQFDPSERDTLYKDWQQREKYLRSRERKRTPAELKRGAEVTEEHDKEKAAEAEKRKTRRAKKVDEDAEMMQWREKEREKNFGKAWNGLKDNPERLASIANACCERLAELWKAKDKEAASMASQLAQSMVTCPKQRLREVPETALGIALILGVPGP